MDNVSRENYEKNRKKLNNKENEILNYNKNKEINNKENEVSSYNKNEEFEKCEVGEDSTKYGEFISSYFAWVSLPQQKENVEKLENITKNEKNLENDNKNEENLKK